MAQYADRIAIQFVTGQKVNRHASLFEGAYKPDPDYIGGVDMAGDGPSALYSYGPHYPVVIQAITLHRSITGYWVNETPYYVTEEDRYNAGFRPSIAEQMGLVAPSTRKRGPSPTTRNHCKSVESALRGSGYEPTDKTRTITTENTDGTELTHTLRLWS